DRLSAALTFSNKHTTTTAISPLSLHDALPILTGGTPPSACRSPSGLAAVRSTRRAPEPRRRRRSCTGAGTRSARRPVVPRRCRRSEEHTSELQSPCNLVCRLLLEKKKKPQKRA